MKTIKYLISIFVFAVSVFAIVSCEEGFSGNGEFLEVTIDGETVKKSLSFPLVTGIDEWSNMQVTDVDEIFFSFTYYKDLAKAAAASTGDYRLTPSSGIQNFDLKIYLMDENHNFNGPVSGTHTITSIKQNEDGVLVEGYFNGTHENGSSISGKYRIILI